MEPDITGGGSSDDQLVPGITVPDPAAPGGQLLDEPFPSWVGPTAFLGAVLFPFLTLGGSLLMLSGEQRPARRSLLKTTAIGSAVWLAVGVVFVVAVFASSGVGSTACRGGVTYLDPPTYTSMDNKNWVAEYPCALGGHSSSPLPPGQQPFGG